MVSSVTPVVWMDLDPSLRKGVTGDVATFVNTDAIIASVKDLISTPYGSRVMRRDYPGKFSSILFDPLIDENLVMSVKQGLQEAVKRYDDRVFIDNIQLVSDRGGQSVYLQIYLYIQGYDQMFESTVQIKRG